MLAPQRFELRGVLGIAGSSGFLGARERAPRGGHRFVGEASVRGDGGEGREGRFGAPSVVARARRERRASEAQAEREHDQ
ncbi:MAG: hypothetical protein AMXMBFR56_12250 [Polyangiaceae bacterium]